jgi:hypothetical protein
MTNHQESNTRSGVYWAAGRLISPGLVLAASPDQILAAAFPDYDPNASVTARTTARLQIAVATARMVTELEIRTAHAGVGAYERWVLAEQTPFVQRALTSSRGEPVPLSPTVDWPATQPLLVLARHLLPTGPTPKGHVQLVDGGSTMTLLRSLIRLGLIEWSEL